MTVPPVVRASEPDELLALVPYLLGFHPEDSLVVLALRDTRLVLTARLDLKATEMMHAERVGGLALDQGADRLVLVAYADDPDRVEDLIDLYVGLTDPVLGIDEAWRVADGRYWCVAPTCRCCEAVAFDPAITSTAAGAVVAGLQAAPSRAALFDAVAAPAGDELAAVEAAYEEVGAAVVGLADAARRERLVALVDGFLAAPRALTHVECAELSILVRFPEVRDVATTRVRRADARRHVDLWAQVARRSVDPFRVAAVSLTGLAAWVSGDGALLNVCIECGEECEPCFGLLGVLRDISDGCVPPQRWESLRAHLQGVA